MSRPRNPFTPTAGVSPPLLVGREPELEEIMESLEDGPGAPARLTLITGSRGVGKTVMLNEVSGRASALGWVSVHETATPGLLERLVAQVARELERVEPRQVRAVTGVTLPTVLGTGGGGVTFSERSADAVSWRDMLNQLLDALSRHGGGVLITVDEVHAAAREDLQDLTTTIQHLMREERDVAFLAAGLRSAVSDLLRDDVLTFLRRAHRVVLDDVPLDAVSAALRETIEDNGREITDDALELATGATGGYPFMIQLVGYHAWRSTTSDVIDRLAVEEAVPKAQRRLGSTVHESALGDLSAVDRTYLVAMSMDDGPSSTGEIARRLRDSPQYANVYRERLIAAGLIEVAGWGLVDFALPHLRQYLRDHAASIEMAARQASPGDSVRGRHAL